MLKSLVLAVCLLGASSTIVSAACPTTVPGTTVEAIKANEQRILCLQRDITTQAYQRQLELRLNTQQTAIDTLRLQRRFDNLPRYAPPQFEVWRP